MAPVANTAGRRPLGVETEAVAVPHHLDLFYEDFLHPGLGPTSLLNHERPSALQINVLEEVSRHGEGEFVVNCLLIP